MNTYPEKIYPTHSTPSKGLIKTTHGGSGGSYHHILSLFLYFSKEKKEEESIKVNFTPPTTPGQTSRDSQYPLSGPSVADLHQEPSQKATAACAADGNPSRDRRLL